MSETLHLHRRSNGVWYYRRRVPDHAVAGIGAKTIQYSLQTTSKRRAKALREVEDVKWSARFDSPENDQVEAQTRGRQAVNGATIRQLVLNYVDRMDGELSARHDRDPPRSREEKEVMRREAAIDASILRDPSDGRSAEYVSLTGSEILKRAGLSLEDSEISFPEFSELVRRALLELFRRRRARLDDNFDRALSTPA